MTPQPAGSPYQTWPHIGPDDRVGVVIGGKLYVDQLKNMTATPPPPKLTRWQRILRWLTPPRWRKPLPVANDPLSRAHRAFAAAWDAAKVITDEAIGLGRER